MQCTGIQIVNQEISYSTITLVSLHSSLRLVDQVMHSVRLLFPSSSFSLFSPFSLTDSYNSEFMPLTGSWILSSLEGKLGGELKRLWSWDGDSSRLDKSRGEGVIVRKILDEGDKREAKL